MKPKTEAEKKSMTFYEKLTKNQRKSVDASEVNFNSETKDVRESASKIAGLTDKQVDLATINDIAAGQIGAQVATIFENGRLTDEDVVRYTRRTAIVSRLKDLTEDMLNGTISKEKAKELKETLKVYMLLGKPTQPELESVFNRAVSILKKSPIEIEIVDEEEAPQFCRRFAQEIKEYERTTA